MRSERLSFSICLHHRLTPLYNTPFMLWKIHWLSAEHLFQTSLTITDAEAVLGKGRNKINKKPSLGLTRARLSNT